MPLRTRAKPHDLQGLTVIEVVGGDVQITAEQAGLFGYFTSFYVDVEIATSV
jgi:hypothetical protein